MKFVITGSLGNISKPIASALVKAGNDVTVITSNQDRVKDIQALGAKAAVGSVEDAAFLTSAFSGADAVYTDGATEMGCTRLEGVYWANRKKLCRGHKSQWNKVCGKPEQHWRPHARWRRTG